MKKKILILVDWFEPGYKAGGPIQSCSNLVKALSDQFSFFIITSDRDLGDERAYEGIAVQQWTDYSRDVKVYYTSAGHLTLSLLKRLIHEVQPFCLYLNSMFSYRFTILPLVLKRSGAIRLPVIVAPRGMLQKGAMQFKTQKKKFFLSLLNAVGIASKIHFHATDEQERHDILHYLPGAKSVTVMSNFPKMDKVQWEGTPKTEGVLSCVFLSRLSPKKNLLYLLTILQSIPPGVNLQLSVGGENEDAAYYKKCISAASRLPANVQVKWLGPIPNKLVLDFYRQFHVFVLPTLGENFGHAVYEALLAGKPVIISDRTPWKGLEQKGVGADIPLDAPQQFTRTLLNFVRMDQAEYNRWSKNAFDYAIGFRENNGLRSKYLELFSESPLK